MHAIARMRRPFFGAVLVCLLASSSRRRRQPAGPEPGLAQAAPGRHRPGDAGAPPGAADHREPNGGTRASGTPGYDASVATTSSSACAAPGSPSARRRSLRLLPGDRAVELHPHLRRAGHGVRGGHEYDVIDYSGSGTASGPVQPVDTNTADPSEITSGCEDTDFAGFTAGNVALVQRGTCTFGEKAVNAEEAGAAAVIIMNQGNDPGRMDVLDGTLGAPVGIPAISVSFDLGRDLHAPTARRCRSRRRP